MAPTSPRRSASRISASAPKSAFGDGSPRAKIRSLQRRQRRAPVLAPLQLQREETLDRELPGDVQLVAEPRQRRVRHRVRPIVAGDEARRRRDEHEAADPRRLPRAQRIATRPPSDQPSTVSGRGSAANAEASAATTPSSVNACSGALWPCPGRSTACTRNRCASRGSSGPHISECIAQPCSSTSGGPCPVASTCSAPVIARGLHRTRARARPARRRARRRRPACARRRA